MQTIRYLDREILFFLNHLGADGLAREVVIRLLATGLIYLLAAIVLYLSLKRPAGRQVLFCALGSETLWSLDGIYGGANAGPARNTVFHRGFQWAFAPEQTEDTVAGVLISDEQHAAEPVVKPTDQISYRWQERIMVIDDSRAKVLVGFVPRSFNFADGLSLRRIHVNTPEGMPFVIPGERYVAFGIVSLDGRPLDQSGEVLISTANTSFNRGFELDLENMAKDTEHLYGLARSMINRGTAPVAVGRVGLTLQASWLTGRRYRMIDYNNNVLAEGMLTRPRLTIPGDLPVHMTEITRR